MNTHKPMKPQGAGCTAFWGEQAAHLVCIAEVPQAAVKPSTALWQNSRARGRLSCGRGPHHKHGGGEGGQVTSQEVVVKVRWPRRKQHGCATHSSWQYGGPHKKTCALGAYHPGQGPPASPSHLVHEQ